MQRKLWWGKVTSNTSEKDSTKYFVLLVCSCGFQPVKRSSFQSLVLQIVSLPIPKKFGDQITEIGHLSIKGIASPKRKYVQMDFFLLKNFKICDEYEKFNSRLKQLNLHREYYQSVIMSSLSNQLAQLANNNATVALDRKRRQKLHSASLIYNSKTAVTQDFDFIFDNAVNALNELIDIEPKFEIFAKTLFSDASISIDRNVQSKEENDSLDNTINGFLLLASSKWHLTPTLHATEWLVRRFQIHIVNAEMLLLSTLNYYQAPVFTRILNIVKIPPLFNPLTSYVRKEKLPTNLTIVKLFNEMAFLKLYLNYLSKCIKQKATYTNQLLFITCCFINLIAFNSNNEEKLNQLVPSLLEASAKLLGSNATDCQIAAHTILVVFANALPLKKVIVIAATETILSNLQNGKAKKSAIIAICKIFQTLKGQGNIEQLPPKLYKLFDSKISFQYFTDFLNESDNLASDKFVTSYIRSIARYDHEKLSSIVQVLKKTHLEKYEIKSVIIDLIHLSEILDDKSQLVELFEYFISINEKLVINSLKCLNIGTDLFEIRLTTSLFTKHDDIISDVQNIDVEQIAGKNADIPAFKTFVEQNSEFIFTENKSLLVESDKVFSKLLNLFTQAVGKKYSAGQFLANFFTTLEAKITFLLRTIISPASPMTLKLVALNNIFKHLHNIDKDSNTFTLVPCLIVALNDVSKNVRTAVKKVLVQISKRPSTKHFFLSKKIYGENVNLPLLSPKDSELWLQSFLSEFMVDNFDISSLLIPKKNSNIFLLYWANQALHIPLPYAKTILLEHLEKSSFSPSNFSDLFEQFIVEYLSERDNWEKKCKQNKTDFAAFEKVIVGLIAPKEKKAFMIDFILKGLSSNSEQLSSLISERLSSIFDTLKLASQIQIVQGILGSLNDGNVSYDPVGLLQDLPFSAEIFNVVLTQNRINTEDDNNGLAKRRRRSSSSNKAAFQKDEVSALAEAHLRKITVLLETLDKASVKGTPELLSSLFVLLSDLETLDQDGGLPVLYAEEVLTSCMINIIESLKKSGLHEFNNLRVDILVSVIRNSVSPQLQNKCLLVVGALASLNPEIILHSIMPIFTFMGAHTIRQDDAFTMQVVEKTILTVVPALLANKKTEESDETEVLLMSFGTALQHVPKHRRVSLFSTLLQALGAQTSIGPFFFLIAQQYSSNVDKFKLGEAKSIVEFAKALLTKFSVVEQFNGIDDFFSLLQQILVGYSDDLKKNDMSSTTLFTNGILNMNSTELFAFLLHSFEFMDAIIKENDSDYHTSAGTLTLRIHSVLLDVNSDQNAFSGIKEKFSSVLQVILSFIDQSESSFKINDETKLVASVDQKNEIKNVLFSLLGNTLNMLPIGDFIDSVLPLLNKDVSTDIKYHVTLVIASKFELESSESSDLAVVVIKSLLEKIPQELEAIDVAQAMLNTLASLLESFGSRLNSSLLVEAITLATENFTIEQKPEILVSLLNVVNNCIQIMGVKCIAFYPKIVPVCIKLFNTLKTENNNGMKQPLQLSILLLFTTMVKSIPSFLTSNLSSLFDIILFANEVDTTTRLSVIELVVENIDPKEILKTLYKDWDRTISKSNDSVAISLFLSILEATVEDINKKTATSQSPFFFKLLLSLFEYRSSSPFDNNAISRIEATVHQIANSYVLKMNDKVFRPLFVILVKWAFDGEGVRNTNISEVERLTAFFKFFNKLQSNLRGIITSYFTYLLERTVDLLHKYIKKDFTDINLHRLLINSLISSFKYDRDDYWRSTSRFEIICESLVNQLSIIDNSIGKYLVKAIGSLALNNNGVEEHSQLMNKSLVSHMKATCSSSEKLWAVRSIKLIYSKVGESWLILLPQLVPTIAELLEDEDEEVELEVRTGLVKVVENVLGEPFDRYLD